MSEVFELSKFDKYREGNRLEVKKANNGLPNSLWDTYSSFSNSNGGVIILGVKELPDGHWETTHLQNEARLLKDFWDIINNHNKVSINLLKDDDVEVFNKDGDVIIAISVPAAKRFYKPVYINNDLFGGTFRRNHEGDYHCTEREVKGMLRDQAEESSDTKMIDYIKLDTLNQETIKSYRERHKVVNPEHVWHRLNNEEYLERIGAAKQSSADGKLYPTVAGLLMFGEEYKIRYEFPEYFLDYREMLDPTIRWTDRLESSSGEWSGNLFDFYYLVYRKLVRDLKVPFRTVGATRIDETPVHVAIREALANCIVNADFSFPRGIVIKKDDNGIVLENPGSIRTGKSQMLKGGISQPRNETIMKMFNLIGVGERAGSGVPDIFATWADEGWSEPVVEEYYNPDRTIVTLTIATDQVTPQVDTTTPQVTPQVDTTTPQVTPQVDTTIPQVIPQIDEINSLISFCEEPKTRQEIGEFLGLSDRKNIMGKYIKPLLEQNVLERTLPDKPNSSKQKYVTVK